jgi:hypothetical protein
MTFVHQLSVERAGVYAVPAPGFLILANAPNFRAIRESGRRKSGCSSSE